MYFALPRSNILALNPEEKRLRKLQQGKFKAYRYRRRRKKQLEQDLASTQQAPELTEGVTISMIFKHLPLHINSSSMCHAYDIVALPYLVKHLHLTFYRHRQSRPTPTH
jgi:hypothetical protein